MRGGDFFEDLLEVGGGIIGQFFQTFSAPFLNVAPGPRNTENTFQFVLKR